MRSYRTSCFVAILAIFGFTVGCGGDTSTPPNESAPVSMDGDAGGTDTAEPMREDGEPAGSGSK